MIGTSAKPPTSTGSKPMSRIRPATSCFASASSPARNIATPRPAASPWKPDVSVLNALTSRAPGMRSALTWAAGFVSCSQPPSPYWLVVSITTLPSSEPVCASTSSTARQGTENITTSPNSTASRGEPVRAPLASAASRSSLAGSREPLNITSCPAPANRRPALPPIRPAPTIAIRIRSEYASTVRRPIDTSSPRALAVLDRVCSIAPGRVTTYADLSPEAPRYAGAVLAACHDPEIPWQRVVRADGSLAQGERQRELLEAEGVPFVGERVDMQAAWQPPA